MRIAIVGGGVSGLVAAHRLRPEHDVTIFEADDRLGGHVHTWTVSDGAREFQVDTGFIVCNDRNYPHFLALLDELGVRTQPSTMSFSVRHDAAGLEYNGSTLRQLFAQPGNALRPAFLRMLRDILRFNRQARDLAHGHDAAWTLRDLLREGGYAAALRDWYVVPMGSAIWSMPGAQVLDMPARFFVDFFHNHGMLTVDDRPEWRVVVGGSARYVEALVSRLGARIRLRHPVRRVTRLLDRVEVDSEAFDRVVFACHSDQALAALTDPSPDEREVLGALPYTDNDVVLHTDTSVLPRRRRAWGAWNYRVAADPAAPAVVTYNMNLLQSLEARETFCVTLNAADQIDPATILGRVRYAHPGVTVDGVSARAKRSRISGRRRTHYCGAYWGNGFHEDGVVSGLAVAREIADARQAAGAVA